MISFPFNHLQYSMISNLIILGGFSLISASFYYSRKMEMFNRMFQKLQKCQKYHLDYVDQIDQLPLDKEIVVFGSAKIINPTTDDKTILKTYIKASPFEDRLWSFQFKDSFAMATSGNQVINVQPSGDKIFAFNLLKKSENNGLEQRVVMSNEPVCSYGILTQDGQKRILKPQMLMGSKHQKLLVYLDQQIIKLSSKSRILTGLGTAVLISHFCYNFMFNKSTALPDQPTASPTQSKQ